MNPRNVRTVLLKELKETLRDRRTLLVMLVVPIVLYPVLLVVLEQLALFGERAMEAEPVRVVAVGAEPEPELFRFLDADSALVLEPADRVPFAALDNGSVAVALEIAPPAPDAPLTRRASVYYDASRDESRRAHELVTTRMQEWADSLLARRLASHGLATDFTVPLAVADSSVASAERMGGYALGRFLPMLLVLMTLLGAFYPAIDLTAGEKERGTLEPLLTAPIPAREIVVGKFLTVVILSVTAGALNLASMLLTFESGIFQAARKAGIQLGLPLGTVGLVLLFLVPLAVLFAALFLGLAVRAQSFKEAQNALTPVQLASLVPTYLPLIPGIPFSYGVAVLPVGGVALLFRELMVGNAPLGPSLVALGATVFYAGLALRFAARSFGREEVLFGGGSGAAVAEPLRARLARWRAAGEAVPRPAAALAFVGVVALLYFYVGVRLQFSLLERGLFASQWLLLALPALLFAVLGPYRARATLALHRAPPRAFVAAALIVAGGIPIGWLLAWVQSLVLEVPPEFAASFQELLTAGDTRRFLWLILLIAVTPAICEELVFRGVLLQGLSRGLTMHRAVLGSAVVFGAFHLSFETAIRFLPTAWLGLLFGYVAWQTRSLFPGMLMHFLNNAIIVFLVASSTLQGVVVGPGGAPRWTLIAAGLVPLAVGLWLLPRRPGAPAAVSDGVAAAAPAQEPVSAV